MIYLDHAATTRASPTVVEAMMPWLTEKYGNPGSAHIMGREANSALTKARSQVAKLMGCRPDQVIFTSGGSEANSLVFQGLRETLRDMGRKFVVTSNIEHESVLNAAMAMGSEGFRFSALPIKADPDDYKTWSQYLERIKPGLVSVMALNNVTGLVNDIEFLSELAHRNGALFHTDFVQAAGHLPFSLEQSGCVDFVSISSHKIHGPKGVGALIARVPKQLKPIIHSGGSQEHGLRGGTPNMAGIVGFGQAAEEAYNEQYARRMRVFVLTDLFISCLLADESFECDRDYLARIRDDAESEKVLHLYLPGCESEDLILLASTHGLCISAGSACNGSNADVSHVLRAIGYSEEKARQCVRVSFSHINTEDEVKEAAKILMACAKELRAAQNLV